MKGLTHARSVLAAAERIVTFSGAGLSAESGIPTFRDSQTGYWALYNPTELASPEGFARNPELVISWYNDRRRTLASATPNEAHRAMAERDNLTHVTQNVDNLLEVAGAHDVLHLHGQINSDRCHSSCGYSESIDLDDPPGLRQCPECGALLRPSVVWFGEVLPGSVWESAVEATTAAQVLLVVGTSGSVFPAAGLVDHARRSGATVIEVNTEPPRFATDLTFVGPATELVPQLLAT